MSTASSVANGAASTSLPVFDPKDVSIQEILQKRDKVNIKLLTHNLKKKAAATYLTQFIQPLGMDKELWKIRCMTAYQSALAGAEGAMSTCTICGGDSVESETVCPYCGDDSGTEAATPEEIAASKEEPVVHAGIVVSKDNIETQREIDSKVARILELKAEGAGTQWDIGKELKGLYESGLYLKRVGTDGKPAYASWSDFCKIELSYSHRYAMLLIDAATIYTRDVVATLGVSKLNVIADVAPEFKAEFIELAKAQSLSRSQLREAVMTRAGVDPSVKLDGTRETGRGGFKAGTQKVKPPKKQSKAEKAAAAQAKVSAATKPRPEGAVAVTLPGRTATVKMWKRVADGKPPARAKQLSDEPHGQIELPDGGFMKFTLARDNEGQIKLRYIISEK